MTSATAAFPARFSSRGNSGRGRVEIDNLRPVPAPSDKAQQIGGRDRGRAVVFERMVIERVEREHRPVEHDPDPMAGSLARANGVTLPGRTPSTA